MASEMCAIAAWKYYAGDVLMHVWLKPRGQDCVVLVQELMDQHFNEIKADTADGVFRMETHLDEFVVWCVGHRRL